jgi:GGDEF domain-containing protein
MTELEAALRREFARASRYREPLSLLVVDRPSSSDVLGRIRDGVRLCDSVVAGPEARVVVILPETPLSGALQVATRLEGVLDEPPGQAGPTCIGVASYPSPAVADAAALLRIAGKALARARTEGGGVFTASLV